MDIDTWIRDLPRRLELAADGLDDLASGVWVVTDEDRDRLFTVEAQVWRIAQSTRKAPRPAAGLVPFLDRSLRAVRSNLGLCIRLGVCEGDGRGLLEGIVRDLEAAIAELLLLPRAAREERGAAGAVDDDAGPLLLASGGHP